MKRIVQPIIFDNLKRPVPGGLYDPALGPVDFAGRWVGAGLAGWLAGWIRLPASVLLLMVGWAGWGGADGAAAARGAGRCLRASEVVTRAKEPAAVATTRAMDAHMPDTLKAAPRYLYTHVQPRSRACACARRPCAAGAPPARWARSSAPATLGTLSCRCRCTTRSSSREGAVCGGTLHWGLCACCLQLSRGRRDLCPTACPPAAPCALCHPSPSAPCPLPCSVLYKLMRHQCHNCHMFRMDREEVGARVHGARLAGLGWAGLGKGGGGGFTGRAC